MSSPLDKILNDVIVERHTQDAKWGGPDHDDEHDVEDWCMFIRKHARRAESAANESGLAAGRCHLIRVAALAVAAIESIDRDKPLTQLEQSK